ncbi:Lysine-specific demethylase JMJ30 [Lamellibrachia satsuma]|nr:Lysine-specific demethylase JMJ30 [Lamellibrachia satsuma]
MAYLLCIVWALLVVSIGAKDDEHSSTEPPGHLLPLGAHRPAEGDVDAVDGFLDPHTFYRDYVVASRPVVFKGAARGIPAYKLWTDTYLKEKFGKLVVRVETRLKETRPQNEDTMPLSAYLQRYTTGGGGYMVQDVIPQMQADLSLLRPVLCGGWQDHIEDAIVWMSGGGTQSVLHSDGMENINCLLDGHKQLIMMDKRQKQLVEADQWDEDGTYSRVDVTKVDLHQFPSLGRVPWWNAEMDKGDCLYIPPRWYHAVKSSGPRNLAANLWFVPLLFFNTSDCARWTEPLPDYANLSSYRFLTADRLDYTASLVRLGLFEKCRNFETITFDDILEAHKIDEDMNPAVMINMMERIDKNGDHRLTWEEIYGANLARLIVEFGPDLEKVPAYSDRLEELRGLVETRSVRKSVVNERSRKLQEEGATPQTEGADTAEREISEDEAAKLLELLKDESKNEAEIKELMKNAFKANRDEL